MAGKKRKRIEKRPGKEKENQKIKVMRNDKEIS